MDTRFITMKITIEFLKRYIAGDKNWIDDNRENIREAAFGVFKKGLIIMIAMLFAYILLLISFGSRTTLVDICSDRGYDELARIFSGIKRFFVVLNRNYSSYALIASSFGIIPFVWNVYIRKKLRMYSRDLEENENE